MKRLSLSARLTIGFTLASGLLVLVATAFLYLSLVAALKVRDHAFRASISESIRVQLARSDGGAGLRFRIEEEWPSRKSDIFYVRLLDDGGKVISESPESQLVFAHYPLPHRVDDTSVPLAETYHASDEVYHAYLSDFELNGARYWVELVLNRTQANAVLTDYRFQMLLVLGFCFVICSFICYQVVRRGLQPLHDMADKAARITLSNLNQKMLPADLPYELAHLAETFDAMLDRLKASVDRLQRFSADIAHELRTPISNISGELQVALGKDRPVEFYKEAIGSALEECTRLSRIIDSLLFLAQAENPKMTLAKERISLRKELEQVVEFYEPVATENGVTCHFELKEDVPLLVERTLFQRAMGNLLSNAIKKTPSRGRVDILVARRRGEVEIEVQDTGEGIPKEHLPHVFDRFYRVDASRSKDSGGSGLGLAIVKSIASIHGGEVKIESEPGMGTHVKMIFPADITNS